MADFNVSHGLFISAYFANEIPKRLWKLTIAFFICPVKPRGRRKRLIKEAVGKWVLYHRIAGEKRGSIEKEVVCPDRIQISLDNPIDYCYLEI